MSESQKQIDDGGPAFPGGVNENYTDIDPGEPTQQGMSLRNYLAANAGEAQTIVDMYLTTNVAMKDFVGDGGELTPVERAVYAAVKVRLMIADGLIESMRKKVKL